MSKDYKEIIGDISAYTGELRKLIPDTMNGFTAMAKAATQTKAIDEKTKGNDRAGAWRRRALRRMSWLPRQSSRPFGGNAEEVAEVLGMAVYMGGGPSLMYAADALRSYDQFAAKE